MRKWNQKSIQLSNKNIKYTFHIDTKDVSYLEDTDRYGLIEDYFLNSSDEIICSCAEEEHFLHQKGFLILDEIPADANLDDDMWWV